MQLSEGCKQEKGKKFTVPKADAVKALILDAQKGKKTEKNLTKGAKIVNKEPKKSIMFKVLDEAGATGYWRLEFIDK